MIVSIRVSYSCYCESLYNEELSFVEVIFYKNILFHSTPCVMVKTHRYFQIVSLMTNDVVVVIIIIIVIIIRVSPPHKRTELLNGDCESCPCQHVQL